MSVVLSGFPQSSYVWSARAALAFAGVEHEFRPMAPGQHKAPDYVARHPFARVPLLEVDGQPIFETAAIMVWADQVGTGALFPTDPVQAAQVHQWVSVVNCYFYSRAVPNYILKHVFAGSDGPDADEIQAALPAIEEVLDAIDVRLGEGPWLVGDGPTAADLLVGVLLMGISRFPEGQAMLGARPKVGRLAGAVAGLAAVQGSAPGA